MALPSSGQLGGTPTNAQFQTYIEAFRDVVSNQIGGAGRTELTIASGAVTPPARDHGGVFRIDTEGNAASDTLDTITQTNTPDGTVIILQAEDAARVVTLNHAAGGSGQILLTDATDFVFASLSAWVMLQRRSTDWVELLRYVPHEDLTALTTVASDDLVEIWDESAGTVKKITPANLVASAIGAGLTRVANGSVSAAASIPLTGLTTAYQAYLLVFHDVLAATSGADLHFQVSTDNGATYKAGASDYRHARHGFSVSGAVGGNGSNGDTKIVLAPGAGNSAATGHEIGGHIYIHAPMSTNDQTRIDWQLSYLNSAGNYTTLSGGGHYAVSGATDAIRLIMSTGNLTTGTYTLFGLRNS